MTRQNSGSKAGEGVNLRKTQRQTCRQCRLAQSGDGDGDTQLRLEGHYYQGLDDRGCHFDRRSKQWALATADENVDDLQGGLKGCGLWWRLQVREIALS